MRAFGMKKQLIHIAILKKVCYNNNRFFIIKCFNKFIDLGLFTLKHKRVF